MKFVYKVTLNWIKKFTVPHQLIKWLLYESKKIILIQHECDIIVHTHSSYKHTIKHYYGCYNPL